MNGCSHSLLRKKLDAEHTANVWFKHPCFTIFIPVPDPLGVSYLANDSRMSTTLPNIIVLGNLLKNKDDTYIILIHSYVNVTRGRARVVVVRNFLVDGLRHLLLFFPHCPLDYNELYRMKCETVMTSPKNQAGLMKCLTCVTIDVYWANHCTIIWYGETLYKIYYDGPMLCV